ncbi:Mpo1-like protein [Hirschia litorea]|uniref:Mpo1-like protein n=1 Tax=Hirschia litorea TaxID=1199156 RepID=A0ABW2IL36_9PROT
MPNSSETEQESDARIQTYAQFWPFYLRQHAAPKTRLIHYVGTLLGFIPIILGIVSDPIWFLAWPVVCYGFAWSAHFFVEHNKPATFTYPFWSLVSDYRMLFQWLTGTLEKELEAAGIPSKAA